MRGSGTLQRWSLLLPLTLALSPQAGRGDLSAMAPARFMSALQALNAVDEDFVSDACQVQMRLMFRAGREWITKDPRPRCAATAEAMRQRPVFRDYVRGR